MAARDPIERLDDMIETGDDDPDCMTCCGDEAVFGEELDDPEWYRAGEVYPCPNCHGSGLSKDQTYW